MTPGRALPAPFKRLGDGAYCCLGFISGRPVAHKSTCIRGEAHADLPSGLCRAILRRRQIVGVSGFGMPTMWMPQST